MTCFFPLSFFHHKVRKERKKFSAFAIKEIQWEYNKRGERFWTALVWRAIKTHLKKKPKKKGIRRRRRKKSDFIEKKKYQIKLLAPKNLQGSKSSRRSIVNYLWPLRSLHARPWNSVAKWYTWLQLYSSARNAFGIIWVIIK